MAGPKGLTGWSVTFLHTPQEDHPGGCAATPPKEGNLDRDWQATPVSVQIHVKTPSKYLATAFSIHDYEKREPSQVKLSKCASHKVFQSG